MVAAARLPFLSSTNTRNPTGFSTSSNTVYGVSGLDAVLFTMVHTPGGQSRAAELMSPVDLVQDSAEKTIKKGLHFCKPLISLVPGARLELARGCPRRILSPLRLPIPPSRQDVGWFYPCPYVRKELLAQWAGVSQEPE